MFIELEEQDELVQRVRPLLFANPKNSISRIHRKVTWKPIATKVCDDFAYREAQKALVPTGAVVSKKRNRRFGKQVSFGSRRKQIDLFMSATEQ